MRWQLLIRTKSTPSSVLHRLHGILVLDMAKAVDRTAHSAASDSAAVAVMVVAERVLALVPEPVEALALGGLAVQQHMQVVLRKLLPC